MLVASYLVQIHDKNPVLDVNFFPGTSIVKFAFFKSEGNGGGVSWGPFVSQLLRKRLNFED